ncbi:MAG: aminopeptidase [Candidatus Cloacimonetes bacterium]|nr:aminopeptidase [Candidatus Cloacimonadota bacterium]
MKKKENNELTYKLKSFWETATKNEIKKAFDFSEKYTKFLDLCKTERETVVFLENELINRGYKSTEKNTEQKKIYKIFRNKTAAFAIIGKRPVSEGFNLIVSHIDSPRIDLKQRPLHEDNELKMSIIKTHYYGGIRKYQWVSTPLALHGFVVKKDGEAVNVCIGENSDDPVFIIPDLLPHLAQDQRSKKLDEAIDASKLNVVFSSIPYPDEDIKETVKYNALYLLNKRYGITETDLLSAELQFVPAGMSRDAGIDKSFIMGYGQDDKVCAYTSMQALFDCDPADLDRTAIVYFADKEEIGSEGNTGAKSSFILDFVSDLMEVNGEKNDSISLRKAFINSQILSADVNAAINPNYPAVHEKDNAVHIGYGVSLTKFTGSRGKSGSNDANAEFMAKIARIFNEQKVNWQIGELGKVDQGGGGTIAKFMAELGAEVIDCGPGVLGMHSLYELTSKADVFSTYKAYKSFYQKA